MSVVTDVVFIVETDEARDRALQLLEAGRRNRDVSTWVTLTDYSADEDPTWLIHVCVGVRDVMLVGRLRTEPWPPGTTLRLLTSSKRTRTLAW